MASPPVRNSLLDGPGTGRGIIPGGLRLGAPLKAHWSLSPCEGWSTVKAQQPEGSGSQTVSHSPRPGPGTSILASPRAAHPCANPLGDCGPCTHCRIVSGSLLRWQAGSASNLKSHSTDCSLQRYNGPGTEGPCSYASAVNMPRRHRRRRCRDTRDATPQAPSSPRAGPAHREESHRQWSQTAR